MIVFRRVARSLTAFATLTAFVFAFGYFSRYEFNRPSAALATAIDASSRVVDRCHPGVTSSMRSKLITYLAIEDYFRPAPLRKIEFMIAGLGAEIGVQPIQTIGIGQIAYKTYVEGRNVDTEASDSVTLRKWIDGLRDDCNNVRILENIAEQARCSATEFACLLSSICLWHTGSSNACLQEMKYQDYVSNIITTYALLLQASGRSIDSQRSAVSLD